MIGSPQLKQTTIRLAPGKTFTIHVTNAGKPYISSVKLNGQPYTRTYIAHSDIEKGGLLEFVMSDEPNKEWGVKAIDRPVK